MSVACAQPDASFIVPREQFLRLLDLQKPGLAAVKQALDANDLPRAEHEFATWFRARPLQSPFFTNWDSIPRQPAYKDSAADAALAGHFNDGYSVYDAPPTGLDWYGSPLSCVTRMPLLAAPRRVYHHTRDPRCLRFMVDHMLGYIQAYPIEEFVGKSSDTGWTSHTVVAKPWYWCMIPERFIDLSDTLTLIRSDPQVSDAELVTILHRLYEECGYLTTQIQTWVDRRHNGGCAMIQGFAMACAILQDFPQAQQWLDFDAQLAGQYTDAAFYPDGMCVELTTAYSLGTSQMVQAMAYALRDRPAMQARKQHVAEMITCLAALSDPMGTVPSFGDLYAGHVESGIYAPAAEWAGLPWVATLLDKATEPPPPFTAWPRPGQEDWCGYYTMRSSWDRHARFMAIDCGPWGTTHQHGDRLSFVITALGHRFIIDPSSTRYAANTPDSFISVQRSGFLHNSITVDGVDEFMGSVLLESKAPLHSRWEHGDHYSLFAGDYSFKPVKPVDWQRRVVFADKTYWLLQDVLTGDQPEAEIEQNFQFEADIEIEFKNGITIARAPGGAMLALVPLQGGLTPKLTIGDREPHVSYWPDGKPKTVLCAEDGRPQVHGRGWTGRSSDRLMPAPAVTYVGRVTLPAMVTVAMVPLEPGQPLDQLPKILRDEQVWSLPISAGALRFETSPQTCRVVP